MKSIIVVIGLMSIISVNALTKEQQTRAHSYVEKCKAEIGIDDETAQKVRSGNFEDDTRKAQCFTKCFFKLSGFMDENDQPQRDVIIKKLVSRHGFDQAKVTEIVDKCVKEKGADGCETAYKIFECYRTHKDLKYTTQAPVTSGSKLVPSSDDSASGVSQSPISGLTGIYTISDLRGSPLGASPTTSSTISKNSNN